MALNLHVFSKANGQLTESWLGKYTKMGFYPAFATEETEEIDDNRLPDYYCVEFALDAPHPVYQFKLRRSDENMLFFLVKENSKVLNRLKVGHVLPMTYYSDGDMQPTKVHETQIQEIINETQGRFRGHSRIQLEIVRNSSSKFIQSVEMI